MNQREEEARPSPEPQQQTGDAVPGEPAPAEPAQGQGSVTVSFTEYEELKTLAGERDEYLRRLQRAVADYQNLTKRTDKIVSSAHREAVKRVVREILPLADNLAQALSAAEKIEGAETITDGLRLIEKKLYDILASLGLRPIEAVGKPFDPHYHEAAFQEAAPGAAPNTVTREVKKGFMIGDEVVRPSQVCVAAPGGEKSQDSPKEGPGQ